MEASHENRGEVGWDTKEEGKINRYQSDKLPVVDPAIIWQGLHIVEQSESI